MDTFTLLVIFGPMIGFVLAAGLTFGVFSYGCFKGYW
jgi:hypothetical protein